jgi:preprotein translocase SecE subunit
VLTKLVLIVTVIMAALLGFMDFVFGQLIKLLVAA